MKAMRLSLRTCPIFVEGFLGDSCINGRRPLEICKASFRTEVVKGFNGITVVTKQISPHHPQASAFTTDLAEGPVAVSGGTLNGTMLPPIIRTYI